jgi:NAD(P)-dependent dehydrogenase (short-subunit alcohol dehydrogenase family)
MAEKQAGQPISGRTALVTGANRGIGRAIAEALLERGAKTVYAAVRQPETVSDPRLTPLRIDVTNSATVFAAAEVATDVDLLVNNAGIAEGVSVFSPDGVESLRRQLETNAVGPLVVTRAFAPVLEANGGGTIVNVLSVLSWLTAAQTSAYSASKAAAWSLTNATRGELHGQGTQVLGVHVAYVDTDMSAGIDGPKVAPDDLARQILDAVERGDEEVLGDDLTRGVKSALSGPVGGLSL